MSQFQDGGDVKFDEFTFLEINASIKGFDEKIQLQKEMMGRAIIDIEWYKKFTSLCGVALGTILGLTIYFKVM